jgi:hypothetical protein
VLGRNPRVRLSLISIVINFPIMQALVSTKLPRIQTATKFRLRREAAVHVRPVGIVGITIAIEITVFSRNDVPGQLLKVYLLNGLRLDD